MELIRASKVEKKANVHMRTIMHIVHEPDLCINYNQRHMLKNIQGYHNVQYEVNLSHQNREKDQCAYVHN